MVSTRVTQPTRIFVFDSPRTCSQLFNKLFAVHPQLTQVFHPFMGASVYGPERVTLRLRHAAAADEAQAALASKADLPNETYDAAAARVVQIIDAIEKDGKIPFFKDHLYSVLQPSLIKASLEQGLNRDLPKDQVSENPTMLRQAVFNSVQPIILIRHPALMVPSYYRAEKAIFKLRLEDEDFAAMTSLRWARIIFDAYAQLGSITGNDVDVGATSRKRPIVIDAVDTVYKTEKLMSKLCQMVGIDPAGIQYHWDCVPRHEWPADIIMQGFFQDMLSSDGVKRAVSGPAEERIDLDACTANWTDEFGVEDAKSLRKRVDEEMPNYEYLKQFRMVV